MVFARSAQPRNGLDIPPLSFPLSQHDYEDVFCPVSTRKRRQDCVFRKSRENGTLASRFERFVEEYDGLDPFDIQ